MKYLLIHLVTILIANSAHAVDLAEVIQPEEGKPISIKADNLIIKNNENLAVFKNNVRVRQGQMFLTSDEVRMYSEYNEKTQKSKLKILEASGNVDFKSADSSVKSDFANYNVETGILNLKGNVRMADSESSLEGKIFTYNSKTGKSEVRNSEQSANKNEPAKAGERVRAIFVPGEGIKEIKTPSNIMDSIKTGKEAEKQN